MFTHQLQRFFAVGGLHELFQRFVAFLFRLAFLIHHLAADEDEIAIPISAMMEMLPP